jgi:hypothetical protein
MNVSTDVHEQTSLGYATPLSGWWLGTWLESVGEATLAAVLTILMHGHEDTSAALSRGALTAQTLDPAVGIDLVVLQDGHLDLLTLVLDLLGGVVGLLLTLLGTSTKTEDKVESGLLLDVVVVEGTAILELLSGEDQSLLVGWDSFLVLDLGLDIVDSIRGFNL